MSKNRESTPDRLGQGVAENLISRCIIWLVGSKEDWDKIEWDDGNGGGGHVQREVTIPQPKPVRSPKLGGKK